MDSYWETVPFDIVTSLLPYLDLENPEILSILYSDPYFRLKLQFDDVNGYLWKFIYIHKISQYPFIPSARIPSLKHLYNNIWIRKRNSDSK